MVLLIIHYYGYQKIKDKLPHVYLFSQDHQGAAIARNLGVKKAQGDFIIFIDSDLVVTESFLESHGEALKEAQKQYNSDKIFTYGASY